MTSAAPDITIIVPAHNEAAVIAHTLAAACPVADPRCEVVVVANACTDDTAGIARAACPHARVLETPVAGKAHALNLAFRAARGRALVFLDADLILARAAIDALAAPLLSGEAEATFGSMTIASDHARWSVRAFYRGWSLNPYLRAGKFGGVFALGRATAARIFPLPKVVADDEYVSRQVPPVAKRHVSEATFVMTAPATLADLIRIRRRSRRGTRALERADAGVEGRPANLGGLLAVLRAAAARPQTWGDVVVYALVITWVRLSLLADAVAGRASQPWERDESSRATGRSAT
jgi:glycosyltransferase involved in cell wall biosynthesis